MFAVVQVGNSQFRVSEGDVIKANRLDFEKGQSIVLDKVLLYADGKTVKLGQPYLKDVEIKAEVVAQIRAPKWSLLNTASAKIQRARTVIARI